MKHLLAGADAKDIYPGTVPFDDGRGGDEAAARCLPTAERGWLLARVDAQVVHLSVRADPKYVERVKMPERMPGGRRSPARKLRSA